MRTFFEVNHGRVEEVKGSVVREQPLTVYVNGDRFLTLLCSPMQLESLVLGYLWMEKVIGSLEDVTALTVSEVDGRADVHLEWPVSLPTERISRPARRRHHLSGSTPLFSRLDSKLRQAGGLSARMKDLFAGPSTIRFTRDPWRRPGRPRSDSPPRRRRGRPMREKLQGEALRRGLETTDPHPALHRPVSSEMLLKAARMGVPLVGVPHPPTEMAVGREQLGITVVGYLRPDSLNLYAARRWTSTPKAPEP